MADVFEQRRAAIAAAKASGPKVGMPATFSIGSDSYGYVVTEVITPRKIMARSIGGMIPETWTLRRNGEWVRKGDPMRGSGGLTLGYAYDHLDPSF